jgi:hypothetical protein
VRLSVKAKLRRCRSYQWWRLWVSFPRWRRRWSSLHLPSLHLLCETLDPVFRFGDDGATVSCSLLWASFLGDGTGQRDMWSWRRATLVGSLNTLHMQGVTDDSLWSCSCTRGGTCPPLLGMSFPSGVDNVDKEVHSRSGRCDGFW